MPLLISVLSVQINHEHPILTVFCTGRAGLDGCCGGMITRSRSLSSTLLHLSSTLLHLSSILLHPL